MRPSQIEVIGKLFYQYLRFRALTSVVLKNLLYLKTTNVGVCYSPLCTNSILNHFCILLNNFTYSILSNLMDNIEAYTDLIFQNLQTFVKNF